VVARASIDEVEVADGVEHRSCGRDHFLSDTVTGNDDDLLGHAYAGVRPPDEWVGPRLPLSLPSLVYQSARQQSDDPPLRRPSDG
jgi:hypothetical protein